MIIAAIVVFASLYLPGLFLHSMSYPPSDTMRCITYCGLGAVVLVVLAVILHEIHETRATRRFVGEALRGRPPMTDEEFGRLFFETNVPPVASRLRGMLAESLECDLAGMMPLDDFEAWLDLFPGPDSAADTFFERVAVEFQLRRDCPWPERFGSFEALVRFVVEHRPAAQARGMTA